MMMALASGVLLGLACGLAPGPLLALVLAQRAFMLTTCSGSGSFVLEARSTPHWRSASGESPN